MPLPTDPKSPWPPRDLSLVMRDIDEASAWYSDDTARLVTFYGGTNTQSQTAGSWWSRFWSRRTNDQAGASQSRLHVPAASDIAATSADMLFGDEPTITIPAAHEAKPDPAAVKTEERLEQIIAADGTIAKLLEAAEIGAALGGVYLRPVWDLDTKRVMLTAVHADCAVPEWRWGQLTAVTFWRELPGGEGKKVWRHLEHHAADGITHALFEGDRDTLGHKIPLTSSPDTATLNVTVEDGAMIGTVDLPAALQGRLLVRYVPNVRPNRKHRGLPIGRPDTQGCEGLMEALDETFTSWMRDIRLGKRRIIVPNEFLERNGRGKGAGFDLDREIFTPLEIAPAQHDKAGITPIDFEIRTQDHAQTMLATFEQIVRTAGYSASTFGLSGEADVTATEYRGKERKSLRTRSRKARYMLPAVEDVLEIMLIIDREFLGGQAEPMRPQIELADQGDDPKARAETLNLLAQANAASIETRVRMAQPNLDEAAVLAEVKRIRDEQGLNVPDPTGGLPFEQEQEADE
jgi:A118 family predicted phage portal protein